MSALLLIILLSILQAGSTPCFSHASTDSTALHWHSDGILSKLQEVHLGPDNDNASWITQIDTISIGDNGAIWFMDHSDAIGVSEFPYLHPELVLNVTSMGISRHALRQGFWISNDSIYIGLLGSEPQLVCYSISRYATKFTSLSECPYDLAINHALIALTPLPKSAGPRPAIRYARTKTHDLDWMEWGDACSTNMINMSSEQKVICLSKVALVDSTSLIVTSCNTAETWIVSVPNKESWQLRIPDDTNPFPTIKDGRLHFTMSLLDIAYSQPDHRTYLLLSKSSSYGVPTLEIYQNFSFQTSIALEVQFTDIDCDSHGLVYLSNGSNLRRVDIYSWNN